MADEKIIIDVNKCKYRDTYTNFCKAEKDDIGECHTICTGNDCYYKQLKRKEQECNKFYIQLKADEEYHKEEENTLRKIIKNKEERNIELYEENNKLKAENENLKKQVCGLRPELKSMIDEICCKYNIEAKTYHKKIVEIINKLGEYKQTLAEIKEIAETCSFADSSELLLKRIKLILQKISEVNNAK